MGASQSFVSPGHFAHPQGWRHRLNRVESNPEKGHCGVCSHAVEVTAAAYRCRSCSCSFVVHESCHRFPKKVKQHFAHPGKGHTLKLSKSHPIAERVCNICARDFGAGSFVYGCNQCRNFYAHPLCCSLPETKLGGLHHHTLTLRAPPSWKGKAPRRCLNATGKCQNATRLSNNDAAAWSYQCDGCRVELCLACQLPGGAAAAEHQGKCCSGDCVRIAIHCLGTAVGTFLGAMCRACTGLPV